MLMTNLINVTLNTLTIGLFCYILLAYYWGIKVCIADVQQANMFGHGVFYLLLVLIAILITIVSAPITYTIYLFSTMVQIENNTCVPVDEDDEDDE